MSKLRGVEAFPKLWKRRTTVVLPGGLPCEVLALPDLLLANKTQRDKDWPMIRRLVEAHYFQHAASPRPAQIGFWVRETRTPELLIELAKAAPRLCRKPADNRPLLALAAAGIPQALASALREEERLEREADRQYWLPRRRQLEHESHRRQQATWPANGLRCSWQHGPERSWSAPLRGSWCRVSSGIRLQPPQLWFFRRRVHQPASPTASPRRSFWPLRPS